MQRAAWSAKLLSISLFIVSLISLVPGFGRGRASAAPPALRGFNATQTRTQPRPVSEAHAFINYKGAGTVGCRQAGVEEARALKGRDASSLKVIVKDLSLQSQSPSAQSAGLHIVLRGTPQLENFPEAKAAFLNAAATWEALIATPITIVMDVDFGPTWFGERYDSEVLGQTDSQDLGDDSIYPEVRDSLVGLAAAADQTSIFSQLPVSAVPTDIGTTSYVLAPSALWRALGFINPIADPITEQSDLGDPPATGFNSAFDYDFDPSDGVDSSKIDFNSVALHEMGHVLGFDSNAGYKELVPSSPVAVSIWDLFRFRPGVTFDTISTAQRILSSGGSQHFFDGTRDLALSTGRPDGTGGDREQASHWKDDRLTGQYFGTMDPTLADGQRDVITENDRAALRSFGYTLVDPAADAPTVSAVSISGKKLIIKGTGFVGLVEIVINGLPVSSTVAIAVSDSTKKIKIKGSQADLNLQSGTNQVQVVVGGVTSNTFTFVL